MEISSGIYNPFSVTSGFLKGIKSALSIMGICGDEIEFPLSALAGRQKDIMRKNLLDLKLSEE